MGTTPDLVGSRFGRLTVTGRAGSSPAGKATWFARCDCGSVITPTTGNLRSGLAKSCGCLRKDSLSAMFTTHGMSRTKLYRAWTTMINRCHRPSFPKFASYGARGIRVCQRWRDDFMAFVNDIGPRPSPSHTLDRIDNDGDYEPGNVRWATAVEQTANRRITVRIEFKGVTRTLAEWSREVGLDYGTLRQRIFRYGWTVEKALTERTK